MSLTFIFWDALFLSQILLPRFCEFFYVQISFNIISIKRNRFRDKSIERLENKAKISLI